MNLHQFPWPRAELESIADTEVELRVTLSYYVEPNPGERGWLRRHRYPSHALRFAVKKSLETVDDFRRRINAAVTAEEEDLATDRYRRRQLVSGPNPRSRVRPFGLLERDCGRTCATVSDRRLSNRRVVERKSSTRAIRPRRPVRAYCLHSGGQRNR